MSGRHEKPDNTPVAIPLRFTRPETIAQQVQRLVVTQFSQMAQAQGFESFEEADDFDIGDDYDPTSPYEQNFEVQTYDVRQDGEILSKHERDIRAREAAERAARTEASPPPTDGGGQGPTVKKVEGTS